MAVLTPIPTALVDAPAPDVVTSGPACSLHQRSGSLWQLGIEAQEQTNTIGLLAQRLESGEPEERQQAITEERQQAITELEAVLLADEGNKAALAAKADATCWVIEHLRGQAAYRQQQASGSPSCPVPRPNASSVPEARAESRTQAGASQGGRDRCDETGSDDLRKPVRPRSL